MAPTVPHILLTAHGVMPGGELWSCGLRTYKRDSFLSPPSGAALAVAVANRWRTFSNASTELFADLPGSRAQVDGVTVRELDIDGVSVTQYEGVPTVAQTTSTNGSCLPNQCALAVSLLTDRAGRTGKGRIYLPILGYITPSLVGGQLPAAWINALVPKVKTLLDGVNTDLATHFGSVLRLAVQSPTAAKKVFDDNSLADYNGAEITSFKIGSVIDTQRRRRDSIPETYTVGTIA